MATPLPYGNPNWFKRQNRLMTARSATPQDMNDPRQAAQSLYGAGIQLGEDGSPRATRDFGSLLGLNSSQMNALSRGAKPGSFSSLGQPTGSMYANNPGFFRNRLRQRNQTLVPGAPAMSREQRVAQAQQDGSFGAIRDQYNQTAKNLGKQMDEAGNIQSLAPYRPGLNTPTAQSQMTNRVGLEDRAAGLRLLREMSQTPLQVTATDGGKTLVGKYGTGSASNTSGAKNQGMIDGQPASDVLRELANKQVREGTWRKGDRLPDAETQNAKTYDRVSRSGLLTEDQALSESEKARQSRQSLQRLTKR